MAYFINHKQPPLLRVKNSSDCFVLQNQGVKLALSIMVPDLMFFPGFRIFDVKKAGCVAPEFRYCFLFRGVGMFRKQKSKCTRTYFIQELIID